MSTSSRQQLRAFYRAKRRALSEQQQALASEQILCALTQMSAFQDAQHIALYLPNDGELNPTPVIHHAWSQNKQVYLPILHPFYQKTLVFVNYTKHSIMINNKFGIPEPKVECPLLCPIQELDIIFTPLVAFDVSGNRMGMGGGFYDRTLAPLKRVTPQIKNAPKIIGLAHDCQQAETLPTKAWDIPLNAILTPTQLISAHGLTINKE